MFPHYNVVVIPLVMIKFGTGMKLDVFYTLVRKSYGFKILIYDDLEFRIPGNSKPLDYLSFNLGGGGGEKGYFRVPISDIKLDFTS